MCLPNFLIVGCQKAGTTWLANRIRQHPDIFLCDHEIHFFDKDYNYGKGIGWYREHFAGAGGAKAVGERTPDYFWTNGLRTEGHLPEVHRNIGEVLPEAKLVVILRDPVERAISAANHVISSGRISPFHNLDSLLIGERYLNDIA